MGGDWRKPADPAAIEKRLKEDKDHTIKAGCIVHNETSTGVVSEIGAVRRAIDAARHPCPAAGRHDLLAGLDRLSPRCLGRRCHRGGSQKGLMLPPGLSFNAVSEKALTALQGFEAAKAFWNWDEHAGRQRQRLVPLHARDKSFLRPERGPPVCPNGRRTSSRRCCGRSSARSRKADRRHQRRDYPAERFSVVARARRGSTGPGLGRDPQRRATSRSARAAASGSSAMVCASSRSGSKPGRLDLGPPASVKPQPELVAVDLGVELDGEVPASR